MPLRAVGKSISIASIVTLAGLAACETYVPPPPEPPPAPIRNSAVIEQPFDTVWARAVPALGTSFYVINNIDKSSGLINLSYNGDPSDMINCRPAVFAQQCRPGGFLEPDIIENCTVGPMTMDGRTNIIFERIADDATRVTINVRHQISQPYRDQQGTPISAQSQFNTNQEGRFLHPALQHVSCRSTGTLERTLLQLVTGMDILAVQPPPPPLQRLPASG